MDRIEGRWALCIAAGVFAITVCHWREKKWNTSELLNARKHPHLEIGVGARTKRSGERRRR